jgi:ATP-dependent DNA helicase DinG
MHSYFGPGGRLAAALPGFEPRGGQAVLAQEVADALERGEHLLAEAGTGTGKSLA